MKRLKLLLVLFFIFSLTGSFFAQRSILDSLKKLLSNSKKDSATANIICEIGIYYLETGNLDTAKIFFKKSISLAREIKDTGNIHKFLGNLGTVFIYKGDYENALKYNLQALNINLKSGSKYDLAVTYQNLGVIYENKGNFAKALDSYIKALKLSEEINYTRGIALGYMNVGLIYESMNNHLTATKYILKAADYATLQNDKNGLSYCYTNLGNIYKKRAVYDSASFYLERSAKMFEDLNDANGLANTYNSLGEVYKYTGLFPKAIEQYEKALNVHKQYGNEIGITVAYHNLGETYGMMKQYTKAEEFLKRSLDITVKLNFIELFQETYLVMSNLAAAQGDYKNSLLYFKKHAAANDSLLNKQNTQQMNELNTVFESEKKDKALIKKDAEIRTQNAENDRRKTERNAFIIGFILMVTLAFFIFKGLKQQRKATKIISGQKNEVEHQKLLVEEKHKEITDSINYAERIQRSFLATKELLNENLQEYFVFFQPKDIVSGDFYWAGKLNNGSFALATADSTGHGVPGSIMSILNTSSLEKAVEQNLCEPSEILNHTRKTIIERLKKDGSTEGGKDGMDCSLICFNFEKSQFTYSAANNPVWLIRKKNNPDAAIELHEYAADKMPVGKHDKDSLPFSQHSVDLQKGDVIYAFTDGLPDQFGGPKGKKFMYKQLKELLISISQSPMEIQKLKLSEALINWKGSLEQVDDITIIGIRI